MEERGGAEPVQRSEAPLATDHLDLFAPPSFVIVPHHDQDRVHALPRWPELAAFTVARGSGEHGRPTQRRHQLRARHSNAWILRRRARGRPATTGSQHKHTNDHETRKATEDPTHPRAHHQDRVVDSGAAHPPLHQDLRAADGCAARGASQPHRLAPAPARASERSFHSHRTVVSGRRGCGRSARALTTCAPAATPALRPMHRCRT